MLTKLCAQLGSNSPPCLLFVNGEKERGGCSLRTVKGIQREIPSWCLGCHMLFLELGCCWFCLRCLLPNCADTAGSSEHKSTTLTPGPWPLRTPCSASREICS